MTSLQLRTRRQYRGFDLIQLAVASFLTILLTTIAYTNLSTPVAAVTSNQLDAQLITIDATARAEARAAERMTPTPADIATAIEAVALPTGEQAEGSFDLAAVDTDGDSVADSVRISRSGECRQMLLDADASTLNIGDC